MYLKKTRLPERVIHTIGHSNHPLGTFLEMLRRNGIRELVDVRSTPFSRHVPHFNRQNLEEPLEEAGIAYRFMGEALGGRPANPEYYDEAGSVQYHLMANDPAFREAVREMVDRCQDWSIALMCTEADPLACHRTLLVAQAVRQATAAVHHIMRDGQRENHDETLTRLCPNGECPGETSRTCRVNRSSARRSACRPGRSGIRGQEAHPRRPRKSTRDWTG